MQLLSVMSVGLTEIMMHLEDSDRYLRSFIGTLSIIVLHYVQVELVLYSDVQRKSAYCKQSRN
jgi:hypothetical protein